MDKLKSMPGMKNMQKMMSEMGLPTGGKNTKVDMGAFQGQMKRNIGKAKTKERLQRKLAERREAQSASLLSPEDQIKLLQTQLAEARAGNTNSKTNKKKRRRRRNKGKK